MSIPHVIAVPVPAQGHVIPLMKFVQNLVKQGYKVTFVITDFIHKPILESFRKSGGKIEDVLNLVSIPDGLEPWEDRNDMALMFEAFFRLMPGKLEEVIEKINATDDNKITCLIADGSMGWDLKVVEKIGIKRIAFWPSAAATMVSILGASKLIEDGIINEDGTAKEDQIVSLSPNMPMIKAANLGWVRIGDLRAQRIVFKFVVQENNEFLKLADWIVCNSAYEVEAEAFTLSPANTLSIGPLEASNEHENQAGCFWQEDSTCLAWLDQQPICSVIYVAFGSITVFDATQFRELALGLKLTNKPFLWVVRPDMIKDMNETLPGLSDMIGTQGKTVAWAPQQKVLRHPSVACFLSHCGWNSTVEGVSSGVPFLCWPYFADQFVNESYIWDIWKVGLRLDKDDCGIIRNEEVKNKLEHLLCDNKFKARAMDLKEKVVNSVKEHGSSHKNLSSIINWISQII